MKTKQVPIEQLSQDPSNVRRHSERNLSAIVASLRKFGQQKPIVIDGKGIILAGNGTYEAAKRLGWDTIAVVQTDLKGSEAIAYAIADNRTAELAEWHEVELAETLRALQSEGFDIEAAGYLDVEVDQLLAKLGNSLLGRTVDNPDDEWDGMPEFEQDEIKDIKLTVYFTDIESKLAFASQVGQSVNQETLFVWYPKDSKPMRQSAESMVVESE